MSVPDDWRLCGGCGHWLPGLAFSTTTAPRLRDTSRKLCIPCEEEHRTAYKRANRWRIKARSTTRDHAGKLGLPVHVMRRAYGWDEVRMGRDMEHAYAGRCCDCDNAFATMPNGIADLTLDIADRRVVPIYGTNTRFVCMTCNRRKSIIGPEKWGAIMLAYRIRTGDPAAARLFVPPDPLPSPPRPPTPDQAPAGPSGQMAFGV